VIVVNLMTLIFRFSYFIIASIKLLINAIVIVHQYIIVISILERLVGI
jgi:hypothetical protein